MLVVPAASLLTVPFALMPACGTRPSPSRPRSPCGAVARGARTGCGPSGHVALVTGPGLSSEQREVADLRRLHGDAVVLGGDAATVEATLGVLEGARLAHLAAHGDFRADAPLFSSLMLADGPLMVHDLDRLRRPPRSVVLSACDSGGVHPIGADEALGLVSSLLAMGTRSVVASVNPVNDAATVRVMSTVHATVAAGGSLADGLLAARGQRPGTRSSRPRPHRSPSGVADLSAGREQAAYRVAPQDEDSNHGVATVPSSPRCSVRRMSATGTRSKVEVAVASGSA